MVTACRASRTKHKMRIGLLGRCGGLRVLVCGCEVDGSGGQSREILRSGAVSTNGLPRQTRNLMNPSRAIELLLRCRVCSTSALAPPSLAL